MLRADHRQIPSLTGLRFVAAMAVALSHALHHIVKYPGTPPTHVVLLSVMSGAAMTLFFVLSGFVIFLNYSHTIGTRSGLWNFFVARFARLYPLYFVCVAFDLAMKFGYQQFPVDRVGALPYYATLTQSWFYHPIAGQALVYQFGVMPQVSWSISTEWFFYVAFPMIAGAIVLLGSIRSRIAAVVVLSLAALAGLGYLGLQQGAIDRLGASHYGSIASDPQNSLFRWLVYFSPYVRIFEFAVGCLCAAIFVKLAPPSERENKIGSRVTLALLAGTIALHWLMFGVSINASWHMALRQLHQNFGYAPLLAALIFCCARYRSGFVRFLSGKWIVVGGEASYSIYLLHSLIVNAFRYEAPVISSWTVGIAACLQLTVVMAATVGLSLISWRFIEVPCRKLLRRAQIAEVAGNKVLIERIPVVEVGAVRTLVTMANVGSTAQQVADPSAAE